MPNRSDLTALLSAAALIAADRIIPSGWKNAAPARLKEGQSYDVDVTLRYTATVDVGAGTPESKHTRAATVDLEDAGFLLSVIAELGVGEKRLRTHARAVAQYIRTPEALATRDPELDHLRRVLQEVAAEMEDRFPDVEVTQPARPGRIGCQIHDVVVVSAADGSRPLALAA